MRCARRQPHARARGAHPAGRRRLLGERAAQGLLRQARDGGQRPRNRGDHRPAGRPRRAVGRGRHDRRRHRAAAVLARFHAAGHREGPLQEIRRPAARLPRLLCAQVRQHPSDRADSPDEPLLHEAGYATWARQLDGLLRKANESMRKSSGSSSCATAKSCNGLFATYIGASTMPSSSSGSANRAAFHAESARLSRRARVRRLPARGRSVRAAARKQGHACGRAVRRRGRRVRVAAHPGHG